jgi:hypothetical protein
MKFRNAMRPIISGQLLRPHRDSLQVVLILHRRRKGLLLVPNGRRCTRRSGTESSSSLSQTLRPLSSPTEEPECEERADDEGDTHA